MDVDSLSTFSGVARSGSFASHAREKGTDPSSVSRQIAALEEELGVRLFERTTRRLSLTEAGRVYLDRIAPLLEELSVARDAAHDSVHDPSGVLSVTTSVAFGERWLMPRVASFRDAYPKIILDLRLTDSVVDIASEGIDMALRLGPSISGAFVASKLFETRYQVVAAPSYIEKYGAPQSLQELQRHTGLFFSLPGVPPDWRFRKNERSAVRIASPNTGLTISNALALRRAALDGLGLALLADWTIADDVDDGALVPLFTDWEASISGFDTAAWVVYPSRTYVPARLRVFIDHLRSRRGTVKSTDRARSLG